MENTKKIDWYTLAFMAFSTVWGFGNVLNGFVYFNGVQVIFSWVLMFALYFVPYALMVGELGSAFKQSGGGVSSWIHETIGPKCAYYAGWTYWACHVTYIASKGSGGLKALSWMVFQNGSTYDTFPTIAVQMATLAVFLFFCWVASRGLNPLKKLATIAGSSMFVMSILFILMMFAAPVINPNGGFVSADYTVKGLIPQFNVNYFTSLSILVFAVGGCEKISPYVNKVKDPSKGFPKGMIMLAVMVMVCAILGSIAMGMMFDPAVINESTDSFKSYVSNGAYWSFQKLGEYYHVGNLLLVIYAACNAIGQFSTLVLSIDAPLRILLDNEDARQFVPSGLLKKNEHGAYINGIKIVINMGVGEAKDNAKVLDSAVRDLEIITGQKAVLTKAKKSVANFKLREGMAIGCKVTLRGEKMYEFADRLINLALPRVRDFRGVNANAFDGRGNYALGIKEQLIFPEIEYDKVDKVRGMDIIFVTTAKTDEEARELLTLFNMPFAK